MTPMWTLDEAAKLAQSIEPAIRKLGYHTCLGGGVLHKGYSEKDLDLIFLQFHTNSGTKEKVEGYLTGVLGVIEPFFESPDLELDYAASTHPYASLMGKIDYNGKRIDVFIQ